MGVNSLPKTVTRQRRDCDLNPGPSVHEFSTLTTRLRSHPREALLHTADWPRSAIMSVEIVSTAAELNKLHNESTICNTVLIVRLSVQSFKVFTARRYASLVYTVVMYLSICQSVCLSVKRRNCIETTGRIELVSGVSASFLSSTYPTPCYKEIWVFPK